MEKERLGSIKGLLMILVVVGHFLQIIEWNSSGTLQLALRTIIILIYIFHMPLFVWISGYLSSNVDKRRDMAFRDLLIPYFVFQVVFGILYISPRNIMGRVLQNIFIPQFGLWYLLALFIWRIIAKDLMHIRWIIPISVILNLCTCYFSGLGAEMALQRVIGFLVYFMIGLLIQQKEIRIPRISVRIAVILILIEVIGIWILVSKTGDDYQLILDVLCHRTVASTFGNWLIAPGIYFIAFTLACFNSLFFLNIIREKNRVLESVGNDTLPVYISHLALYIIVTRLPMPRTIVAVIALLSIIVSLTVFTCNRYKKIFNGFLSLVINQIII